MDDFPSSGFQVVTIIISEEMDTRQLIRDLLLKEICVHDERSRVSPAGDI